jgi:hypothetical protein
MKVCDRHLIYSGPLSLFSFKTSLSVFKNDRSSEPLPYEKSEPRRVVAHPRVRN